MIKEIGDEELRRAVVRYRDALRTHREHLNRLNVYPVPDGDTGTNMSLTLESVVTELDGTWGMAATCKAISHGSLMGARGNSGVILSQILRGLTDVLKDLDAVDPPALAASLSNASTSAYAAVMRPVEGTILTVVREAAEAGAACPQRSLVEVLDAAANAARDALARTPDLLPVLAEAGVVDAGGAGFVLLLDALLHVIDGRPLPEPPPWSGPSGLSERGTQAPAGVGEGAGAGADGSDLRFEVMFLLEAPDGAIPDFKQTWAGLGDSIVVTGGDGLWNCHIHTNEVGGAIEAALDAGRPRRIQVTDLSEAIEEERWVRGHLESAQGGEAGSAGPGESAVTDVVAVGTGEGVGRILRSLGARSIVAGGQAMNPSTRDILEAVDGAPGSQVVVLPNNRNIVAVAQQVAALTEKSVLVVETASVAEGFAALLGYDPAADAATNARDMGEAAARVLTGEVTQAVRDANTPTGPVRRGEYLGMTGEGISVVASTAADAACALLGQLVDDDHEMVTVIEGESASETETRQITEWLSRQRPDVVTEVHRGDQPLSAYLFSVE